MAKLTIIIDQRRANKNGLFPIKFLLTNGTTSTTITTGIFILPKYFKGEPMQTVIKNAPQAKVINTVVYEMYCKYYATILELERQNLLRDRTAAQIREFAENGNCDKGKASLTEQMKSIISQMNNKGTGGIYDYALRTLLNYARKETLDFEDVNYKMLCSFDRWMEDRGIHTNTRSIIMRCIRRVFNKAIDDDVIDQSLYPFRKFKIKQADKEKEYMPLDKFRLFMNIDLQGGMAVARDFFLLSFYFCGINPIDLFYMRQPQDGTISFVRTKIAHSEPQPIHLKIQPRAQEIIDKYAGENFMLNFAEHYSDYKSFQSYINKCLRKVGAELSFDRCYFYLARYSWATFADKIDISERIIGKALGHTGTSLADKRYISFDWSKVDDANRKVIDYVLYGEA